MSKLNLMKSLITGALVVVTTGTIAFAQKPKNNDEQPSNDPSTKARNVKGEVKEAYKKWLNTDVAYIITKEEKRPFRH